MLGKIAGNKTNTNQEKTGMLFHSECLWARTLPVVSGKPGNKVQMTASEGQGSPKVAVASPKQTPASPKKAPASPKKAPASPKIVRKSRSVAGISDNSRWVSEL